MKELRGKGADEISSRRTVFGVQSVVFFFLCVLTNRPNAFCGSWALHHRCAAMFEGRSDICVPPVVSEQTAERVLTMKFEPVSSAKM